MNVPRRCPKCGSEVLRCPECGKTFPMGEAARCDAPACVSVNAPLDCSRCGMVASSGLDGILDFSMKLIPWRR